MTAEQEQKPSVGRPTQYRKEYADLATKYCLLGATDKVLAEYFEVNECTIYAWKKRFKKFAKAIKAGRQEADSAIAESLYHRGKGYACKETKIFMHEGVPVKVDTEKHYPPDTAAAFIWLKNRQPELWRDKHEVEITGTVTLESALQSLDEAIDVTPSAEQLEPPDDD